jgi:hypothetical protein
MRLNKSISRLEEWFTVPDDADNARILIQEISPFEQFTAATLRSQATGSSAELEFLREATVNAIGDWENFMDEAGDPLPCTHRNKLLVLQDEGFLIFAWNSLNSILSEAKKIREEAEKN